MRSAIHHGYNIRSIRVLQGMKQELFARKMGISQQRVSKLEQQRRVNPETLKAAAKALNTTVQAIEGFDKSAVVNPKQKGGHKSADLSIEDTKAYYKAELAKRDKTIEDLKKALNAIKAQPIPYVRPNK